MIPQSQIERWARGARRRAAVHGVVMAPTLAARLGIAVAMAPSSAASACAVKAQRRVLLREIGPDANFDLAHEVGHIVLEDVGYRGAHEERVASALGAAMLLTPSIVRRYRGRPEALAELACVTVACVERRLREVTEV